MRSLPLTLLLGALLWASCDSTTECSFDPLGRTPFQADYTANLSALPPAAELEVVLVVGPGALPVPTAPTITTGPAGRLDARVSGRAETAGAPPNLRPAVHVAEGRIYLWFSTEPAPSARGAFLPACDPTPEGYYPESIHITAPPGVTVTFRSVTAPSGGPWTVGRPATVLS